MAELSARVLLAQLGLARKDYALATPPLEAIDQRMAKDTLQTSAELACHAALPALAVAETEKAALPILDQAVKTLSSGTASEEPVTSLHVALARYHFAAGRVEEGRGPAPGRPERVRPAVTTGQPERGDEAYRRRLNVLKVAAEYVRQAIGPTPSTCLASIPTPRTRSTTTATPAGSTPSLRWPASSPRGRPASDTTSSRPGRCRGGPQVGPPHGRFVPEDAPPDDFGSLRTTAFRGRGGQHPGAC